MCTAIMTATRLAAEILNRPALLKRGDNTSHIIVCNDYKLSFELPYSCLNQVMISTLEVCLIINGNQDGNNETKFDKTMWTKKLKQHMSRDLYFPKQSKEKKKTTH